MFNTSSFEINLNRGDPTVAGSFSQLGTFLVKYKCPAVVTDPVFIENVLFERIKCGDRFKVICMVDFDNGKGFAGEKFRPLPRSAMSADGFDIFISARKVDSESYNELKELSRFIRENLGQTKEIRWTLGLRSRSYNAMKAAMTIIQKFPAQFIRTDNQNVSDVSLETHLKDIEFIREYVATPIKVCGGLTVSMIEALSNKVARFDMTLAQAQKLIRQAETKQIIPPITAPVIPKSAEIDLKPEPEPEPETEEETQIEMSDAELAADVPPPEAE